MSPSAKHTAHTLCSFEERREIYTELTKIRGKNSADFGVVVINGILIVRRITSIKFLELLNKQKMLFTLINVGSQKIRERILRIKK